VIDNFDIQKIHFHHLGKDGDVVVLLHGFGGGVHHWDEVATSLSKQYQVYIPHLSKLYLNKDPIKLSDQIKLLHRWVEYHFPEKKVYVAGISFGAALAWGLTTISSEKYHKVVLINPLMPFPLNSIREPSVKRILRLPINLTGMSLILRTPIGRGFIEQSVEIFRSERRHIFERFSELKGKKLEFISFMVHRFSWILKNENWLYWHAQLSQVNSQFVLIFDPLDPLIKFESYLAFSSHINPIRTVQIKLAGHTVSQSRPEDISNELNVFFGAKDKEICPLLKKAQ